MCMCVGRGISLCRDASDIDGVFVEAQHASSFLFMLHCAVSPDAQPGIIHQGPPGACVQDLLTLARRTAT